MSAAPDAVRIACVGDSITRGTFVWHRRVNSYPAQLQAMLGDGYCVRNFGVNAHAAQRTADFPYWDSEAFAEGAAFMPHIALIMLGTNDCRGDNWRGVEAFRHDYRELAEHYQALESHPTLWLLTPPALFRLGHSSKVRYGMDDGALRQICGAVEGVARDLGCGLIDVNAATASHPEAFRFDGVHPQAAGALLIARTVFEALGHREVRGPGAHSGTI